MMSKIIHLKPIVDDISEENSVSTNIIYTTIKQAILHATKAKYKLLNINVNINNVNGIYNVYAIYDIININKYNISIKKSFKKIKITNLLNDNYQKEIYLSNFKRQNIDPAKKIIINKIRSFKKKFQLDNFHKNTIIGIVKKQTMYSLIIDINHDIYGVIHKNDLIPYEHFKINDKIKACVKEILNHKTDSIIYLSRVCNNMLFNLLKLEVPEINENIIHIKNIVRNPGLRSKVSIISHHKQLNPVGICLGIRGSRIKNVSNELNKEKIDLIIWNKNIIKYVLNMFYNIIINTIEINVKTKFIKIIINKINIPKAIGKAGQNIKLLNRLTNWKIKVIS